jgi:hypothetical protein
VSGYPKTPQQPAKVEETRELDTAKMCETAVDFPLSFPFFFLKWQQRKKSHQEKKEIN